MLIFVNVFNYHTFDIVINNNYCPAQVQDNVCHHTLGHAYFEEDGGEKRTVIDGNLGSSTLKGTLLPSDETYVIDMRIWKAICAYIQKTGFRT
jgi:hypothetical protein